MLQLGLENSSIQMPTTANISVLDNDTVDKHLSFAVLFSCLVQSVVIILILVLNPLGLIVLYRTRDMQENAKLFFASLTVSDLCGGVFNAIPNLVTHLNQSWVLGDFLCIVSKVVSPTLYSTSIFSLLLLTLDRFIAIVYALRYPYLMSSRRGKILASFMWIVPFSTIFTLFGIIFQAEINPDGYCEYTVLAVYRYGTILIITITLSIILMLYVGILKVARRQARSIAAQQHSGDREMRLNPPRHTSTKSASTVLIITGTVVLSWTPQLIIHCVKLTGVEIGEGLNIIAYSVFLSNSWLNVLIYYWRNKSLRHTFHGMITSCRREPV